MVHCFRQLLHHDQLVQIKLLFSRTSRVFDRSRSICSAYSLNVNGTINKVKTNLIYKRINLSSAYNIELAGRPVQSWNQTSNRQSSTQKLI